MTTAEIAANRAAAVAAVRKAQGLDGIAPADWTYDQRVAYNLALADYIAARPDQFSAEHVAIAQRVQGAVYAPLEETGLLSDLKTFGDEFAAQAVSINENMNPFSQANRKATFYLIAAGLALYLVLPEVIRTLREPRRKAKP